MTTIQHRRDTAANWTTNNFVLAEGEKGYERGTGKFKVGDGTKTWSQLEYFTPGSTSTVATTGATMYADSPVAGSGLTAVEVGNTTDQSDRIQAMLTWLKNNKGGGTLVLPIGTIRCMTGFTLPAGVRLRGTSKSLTILDFINASTSVVAITCAEANSVPVAELKIIGPNANAGKQAYPTNTCAGISLSGISVLVEHVRIEGFFYGVDSTNNNSFFHTLNDVHIGNAGVCWDLNVTAAHNGGTAPYEIGEKMFMYDCVFYNSKLGFDIVESGVRLYAVGCSYDYLGYMGRVRNGFVHMSNCHLETGYAPASSTNWGSFERFMFDLGDEARLTFVNCDFEVRDSGVYAVVTPFAGPANYNNGFVRYSSCSWYGSMPGADPNNAPYSDGRQFLTKDMVYFDANTNIKVVKAPFASKWSTYHAYPVATDGGSSAPAGWSVRIFGSDVSSQGGGTPQQTVTLEKVGPAGTTNNNTPPGFWVVIEY